VWSYDANDPVGDHWKLYKPGKPFGNDLTMIAPMAGIWIHMTSDDVLDLDHTVPVNPPFDPSRQLVRGWNFIGYPCGQTRTLTEALDNRGVSWQRVRTYDAYSGNWLHSDGPGGGADTLTEMKIGKGYWVYVKSDVLWSISYANYA
jgi:hypothetical protein